MQALNIFEKRNIAFFLFVVINFIFCVKYSSRVTDWHLLFSILFSGVYFAIWKYKSHFAKIPLLSTMNVVLLGFFLLGSYYGLTKIPVESLNVDRWSVITSFWDTYFSGEYAYFAKAHTGNPPGPMPFYFILAFPFYALGELGLFSLLGIVAFYFLLKYSKIQNYIITSVLLLLFISIFYLWEIFSRSNVFINGVLVLFSIVYFNKEEKLTMKRIVITAILTGLLMSTRNVFAIPYIITFLFAWRTGRITFGKLALLGAIAILMFGITFLPFVIGHFQDFRIMNPFLVQSTFLIPFGYTIGFILLAVLFGLKCTKVENVYFFSGLTLFISIAIYFVYHFINTGFDETYFGSVGDVSYFILGVPFLLYYSIIKVSPQKGASFTKTANLTEI